MRSELSDAKYDSVGNLPAPDNAPIAPPRDDTPSGGHEKPLIALNNLPHTFFVDGRSLEMGLDKDFAGKLEE